VTSVLLELVRGGHCLRAHRVNDFWKPLFALLVTCGDPRVRDVTAQEWARRDGLNRTDQAAFDKRLAKWRQQLDEAYAQAAPELAADERAALTALIEVAAAPAVTAGADAATEAGLLAAVYAAPADDAPRAIYADWLQERGDPRGELIALQLGD